MPDDALIFGPFALHLQRRELTEAGRPLRVGSRALDILMILTERPGEVIGKDELLARVWPNTTVEETNLRVHIAGLARCCATAWRAAATSSMSPAAATRS
jgi:DNA-binding winged helix-turn-helix (wHTH) protein